MEYNYIVNNVTYYIKVWHKIRGEKMVYSYITSVTPEFMELLQKKFINENITLMFGKDEGLLYHETSEKSVFQVPRKYEVVDSKGSIPEKGFALFHYIPTTKDFRPNFEHQLLNRPRVIDTAYGFFAVRVLRPLKGNTYLIITIWLDRDCLEKCQENEAIMEKMGKEKSIEVSKLSNYAGQSYTKEYIFGELEDNS
jgi:heme oxygenase (mycobilin-producing)